MEFQLGLFGNDLEQDFESIMRMVPSTECDYATHNIHPYPAKFLPHYPKIFIRYFSQENDLVCDPMCGSGTTLIEASLQNRRAYGIDIDPIGALISRVSLIPITESKLNDYEKMLFGEIEKRLKKGESEKIPIPSDTEFPNIDIWFREDVVKELILIRDTIYSLKTEPELEDFGLVCLSNIVKTVSNADPRDIFPERDLKEPIRERKDVNAELRRSFHKNKYRVVDYAERVNLEDRGNAIQGDAREISLGDQSVDLVFTSPPYAYAIDYARVFKLSTLLFVMSNEKLLEYRKNYVGTDRVSVRYEIGDFRGFEFAKSNIENVHSSKRKLGAILYKYFADMHQITTECYRILKPNSHLIYVVGNSTVKGTEFETADVFSKICEGIGFKLIHTLERPYYAYRMARKRNIQSNTIKSDKFIIIQKPNT